MADEPYLVQDVHAPARFADALARFAQHVEDVLQAVEIRLRAALRELAEREARWSREVRDRRLGHEEASAERGGQDLEEAEAALEEVRTWRQRVDEAVDEYRRVLRHVRRLLAEDTPKARAELAVLLEILHAYLREPLPDSASAGPATASTGRFATPGGGAAGAGDQPVSGFDASPFRDDAAVEAYLAAWIPAAHRNPATLRGIRYDDRFEGSPGGEVLLGYTTPDPDHRHATITILRHSESGAAPRVEVAATLAHEVAHHVHLYVLSPADWSAWEKLHVESSAAEFVTPYARKNAEEDFGESYAYYMHYPDELELRSPGKHAFMRDAVFAGRDYSDTEAPRYSSSYEPDLA